MGYNNDGKVLIYSLTNGNLEKEIQADLSNLFAYSNNALLIGKTIYSNLGIKYDLENK